jgi:hypothetical protein
MVVCSVTREGARLPGIPANKAVKRTHLDDENEGSHGAISPTRNSYLDGDARISAQTAVQV